MYRLLAIDLDGTLLGSTGQVTPRTAAALQRAHAAGMVIAPATARWYHAAVRPFAAMGIQPAAIASAGADVRDPAGTVVAQHFLPAGFATFIAALADRAGWPATLAIPELAYRRDNELPPWAANALEWLKPVTSLAGVDLSRLLSVLAEVTEGDPALAELAAWNDRVSVFGAVAFTGVEMVTVTAPGVNKGSALLALCDALSIDPAETVAVGDSEVDIPMIRAAGLGVAVANGTDDARSAAKETIPSPDDDGIAALIDELLG
ncbi:MAG TPA: HAD family hydrolase [Tepidiformaceae bacterium]|nr:HAD family hydrolase [Tepidiformaceae bacterium]